MSESQISSIDDAPVVEKPKTRATKSQLADAGISGNKRTVTIHASDADGGDKAVFLGVNGVAYQIPRGKPHEVPVEVIEALKNAVITQYKAGADGVVKAHDVPRYAFSVV
jgi:hypothetical protein